MDVGPGKQHKAEPACTPLSLPTLPVTPVTSSFCQELAAQLGGFYTRDGGRASVTSPPWDRGSRPPRVRRVNAFYLRREAALCVVAVAQFSQSRVTSTSGKGCRGFKGAPRPKQEPPGGGAQTLTHSPGSGSHRPAVPKARGGSAIR